MSAHDLPFPGCYWVIPGTLMAGPYPGGHDRESTEQRLRALLDCGIQSVIDLMDEDETEGIEEGLHYFPYEDMLEDLGEERNIVVEIARYGIEAGSLPDDAEVSMILDSIDAEIDGRNSPTMVHCSDGLGRTAVIVGCYLARHDIAVGAEVIERIQALRAVGHPESTDGRSPENIVQERMISRWKPGR